MYMHEVNCIIVSFIVNREKLKKCGNGNTVTHWQNNRVSEEFSQ